MVILTEENEEFSVGLTIMLSDSALDNLLVDCLDLLSRPHHLLTEHYSADHWFYLEIGVMAPINQGKFHADVQQRLQDSFGAAAMSAERHSRIEVTLEAAQGLKVWDDYRVVDGKLEKY